MGKGTVYVALKVGLEDTRSTKLRIEEAGNEGLRLTKVTLGRSNSLEQEGITLQLTRCTRSPRSSVCFRASKSLGTVYSNVSVQEATP